MDKIKKIEQIVKRACDTSKYFLRHEFQWQHTDLVRESAIELAKKLKADVELCEVAALLHDIGRMRYGPENHEITSARDAEKILKKLSYNADFIKKASRAILTHRGSTKLHPVTKEEKIVACADAMSHFKDAAQLFYTMCKETKRGPEEIIDIFDKKLDRAWVKVSRIPIAKRSLQRKRKALKLIFGK